jgi:hypothetical protein
MRDLNGFRFPWCHPYHSLFKIRDHFGAAYRKLQGFAPHGAIEYCAISQFAGIVDINGITLFRLCHRFPSFVLDYKEYKQKGKTRLETGLP